MENDNEFMEFVIKNNDRAIKQGERIDKLLQHQNIEERILERLNSIEYKIDTITKKLKEKDEGYFDVFGDYYPKTRKAEK